MEENKEKAIKVEVLKDFPGSPDGFKVIEYKKGEIVEMPESLATVAIGEKWVKKPGAMSAADKKAAELAEKRKALTDEIAELETKVAAAEGDDKAALEAELAKKQGELKELPAA